MVTGADVALLSTESMWRGGAANRMLGMEVVSVEPGSASVRMVERPDMATAGICATQG